MYKMIVCTVKIVCTFIEARQLFVKNDKRKKYPVRFTNYFLWNSYDKSLKKFTNTTDSICNETSSQNEVNDAVHADVATYPLINEASEQSSDSDPLDMNGNSINSNIDNINSKCINSEHEHSSHDNDIEMHSAQNMDR